MGLWANEIFICVDRICMSLNLKTFSDIDHMTFERATIFKIALLNYQRRGLMTYRHVHKNLVFEDPLYRNSLKKEYIVNTTRNFQFLTIW